MQRRKILIGILAFTLVFGTVTGCASRDPAPSQPLPYEVGRVTAILNGTGQYTNRTSIFYTV